MTSASNKPTSDDITNDLPDLVQSFSKLLLNVSGDSCTLNKFQDMISEELERTAPNDETVTLFSNQSAEESIEHDSEESSIEEPPTEEQPPQELLIVKEPTQNLTTVPKVNHELDNLVSHLPSFLSPAVIRELNVENELCALYTETHPRAKYMWLTDSQVPYSFGGKKYHPQSLSKWNSISSIMRKINEDQNLDLDSCLIARYQLGSDSVSLHQDNEEIIDNAHPIVIAPFGTSRSLHFFDSYSEASGNLIMEVAPVQGDIVIMNPGCQEKLWHKLLPNQAPLPDGPRFALSFRKLNVVHQATLTCPLNNVDPITSTPIPKDLHLLPNGFGVHPERAAVILERAEQSSTVTPTVHSTRIPPQESIMDNRSQPVTCPKHLILGDSLVKGLQVPRSVSICKGGIKPGEVLQLLPSSTDLLHPDRYSDIRTVTLIVGTNALNVNRPNKGMPLLNVINDYEKLVNDLRAIFPNARLGLYNVLPRVYSCPETRNRIEMFNDLFDSHITTRLKNVFWIRHFYDFLDEFGYIRHDLYGKLGIHLKPKGKAMMARVIRNFQNSYK